MLGLTDDAEEIELMASNWQPMRDKTRTKLPYFKHCIR
jgi:hypothetical protein